MIGNKISNNNTCETTTVLLAEEMLPPSFFVILMKDSAMSMGVYHKPRDGDSGTNRALVRGTLLGCGKGNMGRLLRNIALNSIPVWKLISTSTLVLYNPPKSRTTIPIRGYHRAVIPDHSWEACGPRGRDPGPTDYVSLITRHHHQEDLPTWVKKLHSIILPCPI